MIQFSNHLYFHQVRIALFNGKYNPSYNIIFIYFQQASEKMEIALNNRQAYKNKKNEEADEIYYCQCGKNYLTFAALYLHARNKHDIKLTTKRSQRVCTVEFRDKKYHVTYFMKLQGQYCQNKQKFQNQMSQYEGLHQRSAKPQEVLLEYIQFRQYSRTGTDSIAFQTIDSFGKYLSQFQISVSFQGLQPIEQIPYYFNDFLSYYLPQKIPYYNLDDKFKRTAEYSLVQLWQWLYRTQKIKTQLLYNSASWLSAS